MQKSMKLALLVLVLQGRAAHEVQLSPPMGWNSYDAFGASVTEEETLANARAMKKNLLAHGWSYVVIDARWHDTVGVADDRESNNQSGPKSPMVADDLHWR